MHFLYKLQTKPYNDPLTRTHVIGGGMRNATKNHGAYGF